MCSPHVEPEFWTERFMLCLMCGTDLRTVPVTQSIEKHLRGECRKEKDNASHA